VGRQAWLDRLSPKDSAGINAVTDQIRGGLSHVPENISALKKSFYSKNSQQLDEHGLKDKQMGDFILIMGLIQYDLTTRRKRIWTN
jgi:hypothetical protein